MSRASTSYKKKDGQLTVSDDRRYLFWTPATPAGASPAVTIPIADITNLQQTPATTPKVALKVFVKEESHVFSFTSKDSARKEQEAITDTLRNTIATSKAASGPQLAAAAPSAQGQNGGDAGQSAAMAIAKAVSSNASDEVWYDDTRLKTDFQLQRSLLESNKTLNDRFTQALRDKPDTVTVPQFTAQFWSTRLHLLRAHAIEKAQKEGEYNVLPEIKYTSVLGEDGTTTRMLNMTKGQVALIFKQYPVVRRAFNENTPKPLSATEFWARFFGSKLLKKLKGVRVGRDDPPDGILDRYLDQDENRGPASIQHIPLFIDLEGNEQNSKFNGNQGDWEMRASRHDQPILHVLNNLSEKMLSHVAPEDGEAHGPIGMDEQTFEQLQLRDLAMSDADNRVVLNVREQQRYLAGQGEDDLSADAKLYLKQDPNKVISSLRTDLQPSRLGSDEHGTLRLDRAISFQSDDESDSEDESLQTNGTTTSRSKKSTHRINSHASINSATHSIVSSISQRRANASGDPHSLNGLSQSTFDSLTITHNTTIEFLHYFWSLFLSGDASKSAELGGLVSTLDKSLDRIQAVSEQAEKERQERLERMRKQVREMEAKTGKRRRIDESAVSGGKAVVDAMVKPTVGALRQAVGAYRKAFEEQTKEAAAAGAS